jgi:hypothetical protein
MLRLNVIPFLFDSCIHPKSKSVPDVEVKIRQYHVYLSHTPKVFDDSLMIVLRIAEVWFPIRRLIVDKLLEYFGEYDGIVGCAMHAVWKGLPRLSIMLLAEYVPTGQVYSVLHTLIDSIPFVPSSAMATDVQTLHGGNSMEDDRLVVRLFLACEKTGCETDVDNAIGVLDMADGIIDTVGTDLSLGLTIALLKNVSPTTAEKLIRRTMDMLDVHDLHRMVAAMKCHTDTDFIGNVASLVEPRKRQNSERKVTGLRFTERCFWDLVKCRCSHESWLKLKSLINTAKIGKDEIVAWTSQCRAWKYVHHSMVYTDMDIRFSDIFASGTGMGVKFLMNVSNGGAPASAWFEQHFGECDEIQAKLDVLHPMKSVDRVYVKLLLGHIGLQSKIRHTMKELSRVSEKARSAAASWKMRSVHLDCYPSSPPPEIYDSDVDPELEEEDDAVLRLEVGLQLDEDVDGGVFHLDSATDGDDGDSDVVAEQPTPKRRKIV